MLSQNKRMIDVFGAAGAQGQAHITAENFTLTDALAQAGGLSTSRAHTEGVFVYRRSAAQGQVLYRFDLGKPEGTFLAAAFQMRDRDIVYITEAPFVAFSKVLDAIQGTAASGDALTSLGE